MSAKGMRGWNFRRGAPNAMNHEKAVERGSKGGRAKVPKGLSDPDVLAKAMDARRENAKKDLP